MAVCPRQRGREIYPRAKTRRKLFPVREEVAAAVFDVIAAILEESKLGASYRMSVEELKHFADALKKKFALPGDAAPEDQLKSPVSDVIASVGKRLGIPVASKTEAQLKDDKVRPDIAIYADGLICGYVELKKPGLGANAPKLKSEHNKKQWGKLKSLPNLIYTDGQEWALYRSGELTGSLVRFADDPSEAGAKAIEEEAAEKFAKLLWDFLAWTPQVPHDPRGLANYLAPMTRFLRGEVEAALAQEGSAVGYLANEWRAFFFPEADDARFADAYAQTVTYAMLLARLSGAKKLSPKEAAKTLDESNGLLARALELLGQEGAREELRVGFELLQRSLEALNPAEFLKGKPDLWLYFYEDFLAAYDPKLRNDYGVYYTPREVVELQVRLASELLEKCFKKKLGFADDGVVFLDPAVGTGTYLVATTKHGLQKVRDRSGEGAVAARATQMAENMYGFEVLVGPYAVAHLRLKQAIESEGGILPKIGLGSAAEKRLKVYLADTLESPFTTPPGGLDLTHRKLTEEREAARKVKQGGEILVCIGNPPYDRQQRENEDEDLHPKGGWVRFGDKIEGGADREYQGERPIFNDFLDPVKKAGAGGHLKNIYNDYAYFWRWALWRLFEQQNCGGIVTFITASSYLTGPGFAGMREVMRRTFDQLWVIDLGGDNNGPRKSPNVFKIKTPVAIAIGVRGSDSRSNEPSKIHYSKIAGATRDEKLAQLEAIENFDDLEWSVCPNEWHKPFRPAGVGDFFEWPRLEDIFPWVHSGAQFKRSWPIGETKEVLSARLDVLKATRSDLRKRLFRETRDRKITYAARDEVAGRRYPSIYDLKEQDDVEFRSYCFRSFDRQYAIVDPRFGDFLRPALIETQCDKQIFISSLFTDPLAIGAAVTVASYLPDLHHFNGRGGRDVVPLYRDAEGKHPNITSGLEAYLRGTLSTSMDPETLVSYVYGVLGGQSYTSRFWNELETPGPRVPLTKDTKLFEHVSALGRKLIWLHTYGERFQPSDGEDQIPPGKAKIVKGVSNDPEKYPESHDYDAVAAEIQLGDGIFGPVSKEVWEFEVSGLKVVQSWLGYRMKKRAGKKSSPLDDIRPERWTARMSEEFLELLWVLEATLDIEPKLAAALDAVVAGPCFKASELPQPTDEERKPPKAVGDEGDLLALMGVNEEDDEDGED